MLENKLAIFISFLFHPLWMPFYMVLLLFNISLNGAIVTSIEMWTYISIVVIINTLLLPVSLIWLMVRLGIIESMRMSHPKDRLYPFLVSSIFYFTTWYIFHQLGLFAFLDVVFIIAIILVFLAFVMTIFWKISVHSLSMGAISAAVLVLTAGGFLTAPWFVYLVFIFSGMTGFARLKLKAHSPAQIYVGYLLGFIVVTTILNFISY